jgi:hypothetical protein
MHESGVILDVVQEEDRAARLALLNGQGLMDISPTITVVVVTEKKGFGYAPVSFSSSKQ